MFDATKTTDIQALVLELKSVPLGELIRSAGGSYRYGYIGTKDRTMYPLIMPGAIVQVDEKRKRVMKGPWRCEFERPIYFLETHTGYTCCWCGLADGNILLQPHPLSPERPQMLDLKAVDIVGQVVGVAMRFNSFRECF
jgi:hypothetical protein